MKLEPNNKHINLDATIDLISKSNEIGCEALSTDELRQLALGILDIVLYKETQSQSFKQQIIQMLSKSLGYGVNFTPLPAENMKVTFPPKYRNPQNYQQTWAGRGIKPNWLKKHLESGGSLDEVKV
jgi:DNA-binding protein H-NS